MDINQDVNTVYKINKLHPKYRKLFWDFIKEVNLLYGKSIDELLWRVVQGYRTFEEQEELFAKGRTVKGKIVTYAKGGQSLHNYGLAIDVMGIKDRKILLPVTNDTVQLAKTKYDLEWGGDWKIKDIPHFQVKGYKWQDLINKGKDSEGYPIL